MAADLDLNDLDEVRRRVVDPVLAAMLRPGELVSAELVVAQDWPDTDNEDWAWKRWPNDPDAERPGDEPNSLWLVLQAVQDEQHTAWLGDHGFYLHDVNVIVEQLQSNLNDWVCETRFGWGELRGVGAATLPGPLPDRFGLQVVGLWMGDEVLEVTVDHRAVEIASLGLTADLVRDLTAWQDKLVAWQAAAEAAAESKYEKTMASSPFGLKISYIDTTKAADELVAARAARAQTHLGRWRRFVAEMEPWRDELLTRLQAELGDAYAVLLPARIL